MDFLSWINWKEKLPKFSMFLSTSKNCWVFKKLEKKNHSIETDR